MIQEGCYRLARVAQMITVSVWYILVQSLNAGHLRFFLIVFDCNQLVDN